MAGASDKKPRQTRSPRPRPAPQPEGKTRGSTTGTPPSKKRRAGGSASKRTGSRYELELIRELAKKHITAQRIPLSGAAGGHFGSDVMVFLSAIVSFAIEVKYRSSTSGFKKFLAAWSDLDYLPIRLGSYLVMRLEDFPQRLCDAAPQPALAMPAPATMDDWMRQAQQTFGVVMIRFPQRELELRWLVVIDASSEQLLRPLTWPT